MPKDNVKGSSNIRDLILVSWLKQTKLKPEQIDKKIINRKNDKNIILDFIIIASNYAYFENK